MSYSCCWSGFVGVSVVLTPAAATSAAGAAPTRAAARDTVSINTKFNCLQLLTARRFPQSEKGGLLLL